MHFGISCRYLTGWVYWFSVCWSRSIHAFVFITFLSHFAQQLQGIAFFKAYLSQFVNQIFHFNSHSTRDRVHKSFGTTIKSPF